jgi:hypothetical protein
MKMRICCKCIHIGHFRKVCPICKSTHIVKEHRKKWKADK